ncbi:MAG: DNA polymerase III subunit delta, partial [Spirochaetales bacterium]|nr:DNA polymerase III subunit delta [Spirochaetales bacterium]
MNNPEPVYLFLGPETGQKIDEIKNIRDSYSKQSGEIPEIHKFYPFDTSVGEIISLMKNGALFSSYKFVKLMNTEDVKKNNVL